MTSAAPEPPPKTPPSWQHCGQDATSADPVGCRGIHVPGHTACLAHLADTDRDSYLNDLSPGADIDHRGTPFTEDLLHRLLTALHDPTTSQAHIGTARFDWATFTGNARFDEVTFTSDARFDWATFTGDAWFRRATFTSDARFNGATFISNARFDRARFETTSRLGPLVCGEKVVLDGAVFDQPVTVEMAAREVSCARTRWASTATLHLRYAEVDLRDAVLEYPVLVAARPDPFPSLYSRDPLSEAELSGREPGVRLMSVGGVDAAHLALHTIDLSMCRFAGAIHLDQLRVDGWCTFATTPTDQGRRFPWRWSRRNTVSEEHHWRVRTARRPARGHGWTTPPRDAPELPPAAVAPTRTPSTSHQLRWHTPHNPCSVFGVKALTQVVTLSVGRKRPSPRRGSQTREPDQ
ncbi:pentapeptide repeat-containing protein [Streptomyces microflavus]|uniref:pentapeptide repeat-containing protein n=1 Tax=Streptomyces microflavus TaxID=1919 RepID=UPI0033F779BE